jgi:hypothetical protein
MSDPIQQWPTPSRTELRARAMAENVEPEVAPARRRRKGSRRHAALAQRAVPVAEPSQAAVGPAAPPLPPTGLARARRVLRLAQKRALKSNIRAKRNEKRAVQLSGYLAPENDCDCAHQLCPDFKL